jgi:translation elongation factor EF-1alpha
VNNILLLLLSSLITEAGTERGVTMDIAQETIVTPHRSITVLDAPGHRDFIPNMISGASQADCALLVVDAGQGEFEAGFMRGGQTREHVVLVRSLGVNQAVVAVNKLDMVGWDKDRYDDICDQLKTFLTASGFSASKVHFVPVAAMSGVNLVNREDEGANALRKWYSGPSLVDLLGKCPANKLAKEPSSLTGYEYRQAAAANTRYFGVVTFSYRERVQGHWIDDRRHWPHRQRRHPSWRANPCAARRRECHCEMYGLA